MEAATTSSLSYRLTQGDVARLLRELGSVSSGVLGHLLGFVKEIGRPSQLATFHQDIQRATDLAFRLEHDSSQLFKTVEVFLSEQREGQPIGNYTHSRRAS